MDAPLVLSTRIDPEEIDDEAHNIDTMQELPLEFYNETMKYADPSKVEKLIDNVKNILVLPNNINSYGFHIIPRRLTVLQNMLI